MKCGWQMIAAGVRSFFVVMATPDSATAKMQKHEQVDIDEPFRRPHWLRQKVALPECVGLDLEKLVPWSFATLRSGIDTMFFQDHLHGLPGNTLDSQLPEFTENPGVAPVVFAGQFQHQFSDVVRCAGATGFPGGRLLLCM